MNLNDVREFPNVKKLLKATGTYRQFKKDRDSLARFLDKTCSMLGQGSCRTTWDFSKTKVIKVPNTKECGEWTWDHHHTCSSNIFEYLMYKRLADSFPLAPCDLVFYKTIPLILMDKVDIVGAIGDCDDPEWIEDNGDSPLCQLHDGFQIGLTKKGEMVCYDYGYEGAIYEDNVHGSKLDLSKSEVNRLLKFPQIVELKAINKSLKSKLVSALKRAKKVTTL